VSEEWDLQQRRCENLKSFITQICDNDNRSVCPERIPAYSSTEQMKKLWFIYNNNNNNNNNNHHHHHHHHHHHLANVGLGHC
jgi:hypothetical protein